VKEYSLQEPGQGPGSPSVICSCRRQHDSSNCCTLRFPSS